MKPFHHVVLSCALALSSVIGLQAPAQAWTDKPVRLVVPAPPGGSIDIIARILAEQLSADIGQPVIVDNKPGAGGAIAVQALTSAPADGQTLMVTASNVLTEIPHVMKTNFDPLKDLRPVAAVARAWLVLVSAPQIPSQDVKELLAYLKANPGKMNYASYSAGTSSHYAGAIFNRRNSLDMQHVPFQGSPPALTQLIGGQVQIMFDGVATSLPQLKAGKIKAYGVSGKTRHPALPQVPTLGEIGYPELDFSNWLGLVASAKMAPDLIDKINAASFKAASAAKVRDRLTAVGFEMAAPQSSAQLTQALKVEFDRNAEIVKTYGIHLNQ
jgi:tripartite-type tricarboxylate transporter receptor subunit TctC